MIRNESPTPAEYIVINIYIHPKLCFRFLPPELIQMEDSGMAVGDVDGRMLPLTRLYMNHAIPTKIPVFQGNVFRLLSTQIVTEIPTKGNYMISWNLMSPKMQLKEGVVFLVWDEVSPKIKIIENL